MLCGRSTDVLAECCDKLRTGEVSARSLTEEALTRIQKTEGKLNAFITVCGEEALRQAELADARIAAGKVPPLCGIPMALKDNICTAGIRTTCASRMLADFVPCYNAFVWERLHAQGAVLLGKTNMDEFAMGAGGETSAFGVCRNPWDTDRVAGGSSGGSAAAVASGTVLYALGSDTGGSVRVPAAYCGVVGMKPTYGRVSRRGLVAFASSLDQIGVLTRSVRDSAQVLAAICGHDEMDAVSADRAVDFMHFSSDVRGMRVGILAIDDLAVSEEMRVCYDRAEQLLCLLGAQLIPVTLPLPEEAYAAYYLISSCEASSNLARYDGIRYGRRAENPTTPAQTYTDARKYFGDEVKRRLLAGTYALSANGRGETYEQAQRMRRAVVHRMNEIFTTCDAVLTPTVPECAYRVGSRDGEVLAYERCDTFTVIPSLAGLPAISIPAGKEQSMPLGIQLVAPAFREDTLYRAAAALEEAIGYENGKV